jgi:hypothetical protein
LYRHRQYQSTNEVRVGELQSELKLKTFEFDRLQLLYEENLKSLKTTQMESEKLQKKNDVCYFLNIRFRNIFFSVNSKRIFQSSSSIRSSSNGNRYRIKR